jgi:hypothetical protein
MEYQLTAVYHPVAEGFIGFVEQLPAANYGVKRVDLR